MIQIPVLLEKYVDIIRKIVWSNTTEVGCGMALCSDNSQFWVCNYTPPGNYRGQKPY